MIDLKRTFISHPAHGNQRERYEKLHAQFLQTAELVTELSPESREQSLAITSLQQALLWACGAIAINEAPPKETKT